MLTKTGEYAMRAMVCLVQNRNHWPVTTTQIASDTGVPQKYLSMIMVTLVRQGILIAARGRGGGFRLVNDPARFTSPTCSRHSSLP
jgi:Rrf2 family protein